MSKYSISANLILLEISSFEGQESDINDLFFNIIDSKNDSEQFDTKIYEWIYNELTLVNEYLKYATEIKKNIINFSPSKFTISNSINNLLELINTKRDIFLEIETQNVTDRFLEELYVHIVNHSNGRLIDFYENKIVKLKLNKSSLKKNLSVKIQTIENDKEKQVFLHFLDFLKEYNSNPVSQIEVSTFPKTVDWNPFHCDDLRDFYLYLESKYDTSETKSIFSAFWKFFENEYLIDVMDKRIKQRYITWVNERFNFQGEQMIKKLQTNIESFDLQNFQKHLTIFENSKGLDFSFHDFRDGAIQGTKKRKNSK
jgi:hypothetical protein